jgi:hypothetical protein
MAKAETRLVHKILLALGKKYPGAYFRKIHGSPFQHAGIPDIIGCVQGYFVGLEVKTSDGHTSAIQRIEGDTIIMANGIHGVVTDAEEAIECINLGLKIHYVTKGTLG